MATPGNERRPWRGASDETTHSPKIIAPACDVRALPSGTPSAVAGVLAAVSSSNNTGGAASELVGWSAARIGRAKPILRELSTAELFGARLDLDAYASGARAWVAGQLPAGSVVLDRASRLRIGRAVLALADALRRRPSAAALLRELAVEHPARRALA